MNDAKDLFPFTKWARRMFALALCIEVFYLFSANVLLNSGILAQILSHRSEKMQMSWARAWSPLPGVVYLEDYEIRAQTPKYQWWMTLDQGSMSISLPRLLHRTFDCSRLKGRGLSFFLRKRVTQDRLSDPAFDASQVPPIPDTSPDTSASLLAPQKKTKQWTIAMRRIDVDMIRTVWLEHFKVHGNAGVQGNFSYKIRGDLEVEDVRIQLDQGQLDIHDESVGEDLKLDCLIGTAPYNPKENPGRKMFEYVSGRCLLEGDVSSIGFLKHYFEEVPWFDINGSGRLTCELLLRRGRVLEPSNLLFASQDLHARLRNYVVRGPGEIRGAVSRDDDIRQTALGVAFEGIEIQKLDSNHEQSAIQGPGFSIDILTTDCHIARPFQNLRLNLNLPDAEIPDMNRLNDYLPANLDIRFFRSTTARISAHAEADKTSIAGIIKLNGEKIQARINGKKLIGDLNLEAQFTSSDTLFKMFNISGTDLDITNLDLPDYADLFEGKWRGGFHVGTGAVRLENGIYCTAHIDAVMRDSEPMCLLFASSPKSAKRLKRFFDIHNITGSADIDVRPASLLFNNIELKGESFSMMSQVAMKKKDVYGILYAKYRHYPIGVEFIKGEIDLKLMRPLKWYSSHPGFAGKFK